MTKSSNGLSNSMWAPGGHRLPRPNFYQYHNDRSRSLPPRSMSSTAPSSAPSMAPSMAPAPTDGPSASASASAPTSSNRLSPTQAFHRFEQACQRLRWKFLDLQNSYTRAMQPEEFGFAQADAEINFKVDFHEFYMWIEQAIVLLLLVFGRTITRGNGGGGSYSHAYHHNVLRALEDELCPVYSALGRGDVNQALWKAKELRNRWKDAAEGRETPPLKMYDLTWIVTEVLKGLEAAYVLAAQEVATTVTMDETREQPVGEAREEWEWMVETMDWEA